MSLDPALVWAAAAALIAGITRGFSGFGAALIFVPLISAAYGPEVAAPLLLVIDTVLTLPIVVRAVRECVWRQIIPLAIGAVLTVPLGVAILGHVDPMALRWTLAALAVCLLVLMASGWRYSGRPRLPVTLAVGAIAGTLGGAAQMSGPPVVVYWLGGGLPAAQVRSNLFGFFAVMTLASAAAYWVNGLFTIEVGRLSLLLGPLYALGLVGGARAFVGASDVVYRRTAYAVIALSALASLPLFDSLLRQ